MREERKCAAGKRIYVKNSGSDCQKLFACVACYYFAPVTACCCLIGLDKVTCVISRTKESPDSTNRQRAVSKAAEI